MSAYRNYLTVNHSISRIAICAENNTWRTRFDHPGEIFPTACLYGHSDIVRRIIDADAAAWDAILDSEDPREDMRVHMPYIMDNRDWQTGLANAGSSGNIDIIQMIPRISNRKMIVEAYRNNHPEVGRLSVGYDSRTHKYAALEGACLGGHMHLITPLLNIAPPNIHIFIGAACRGGQLDVVKYLVSLGNSIEYYTGVRNACFAGYLDIVEYLLPLCPTVDWQELFKYACLGGHIHIADYIAQHAEVDWREGLKYAASNGHREMVETIIQREKKCGSRKRQILDLMLSTGIRFNTALCIILHTNIRNIDNEFIDMCDAGKVKAVKLLLEHGATSLNQGLQRACRAGHLEIAQMLLEHGAEAQKGLNSACEGGHISMINLIVQNGAVVHDEQLLARDPKLKQLLSSLAEWPDSE